MEIFIAGSLRMMIRDFVFLLRIPSLAPAALSVRLGHLKLFLAHIFAWMSPWDVQTSSKAKIAAKILWMVELASMITSSSYSLEILLKHISLWAEQHQGFSRTAYWLRTVVSKYFKWDLTNSVLPIGSAVLSSWARVERIGRYFQSESRVLFLVL